MSILEKLDLEIENGQNSIFYSISFSIIKIPNDIWSRMELKIHLKFNSAFCKIE
jgi:hypothetical protein